MISLLVAVTLGPLIKALLDLASTSHSGLTAKHSLTE